jgi:hypothetical protein
MVGKQKCGGTILDLKGGLPILQKRRGTEVEREMKTGMKARLGLWMLVPVVVIRTSELKLKSKSKSRDAERFEGCCSGGKTVGSGLEETKSQSTRNWFEQDWPSHEADDISINAT